jgi:hypothetical protein
MKKCTYVLVPLCDVPWYHSKVESRKSKVESRKSKVEKKRCYSHFCDVKVDTTLRFPGFYPPIKAAQKAFFCVQFSYRFSHTLPTGKGKKADIYQKRRFAFDSVFTALVPLFCRNVSYIVSVILMSSLQSVTPGGHLSARVHGFSTHSIS